MSAQTDQARKILFFTAGAIPTEQELDLIAQIPGQVLIRNARAGTYTHAVAEDDDDAKSGIAGVAAVDDDDIPALYANTGDYPRVTPGGVSTVPSSFKIATGRTTIDLSNGETEQLAVFGVLPDTEVMVDLHASPRVTYSSSDAAKASVSSTGLVTPLVAGTTNIKATYTDLDSNVLDSNVIAFTVAA